MVSQRNFDEGWAMLVGVFPDKRLEDDSARATYAALLCPVMDDVTFMRAITAACYEDGPFAPSVPALMAYARAFRPDGRPDPGDVARLRVQVMTFTDATADLVTDETYPRLRKMMESGRAATAREAVRMLAAESGKVVPLLREVWR